MEDGREAFEEGLEDGKEAFEESFVGNFLEFEEYDFGFICICFKLYICLYLVHQTRG